MNKEVVRLGPGWSKELKGEKEKACIFKKGDEEKSEAASRKEHSMRNEAGYEWGGKRSLGLIGASRRKKSSMA